MARELRELRELREQIVPAAAGDDYVYVDSNGAETKFNIEISPADENFEDKLHEYLNRLPPVIQLFYIQAIYLKVLGTYYSVAVSQLSPEEKKVVASDFSEAPRKTAHIKMLQERYLHALADCKDSPLAKSFILKSNLLDHGATDEHKITPARQPAIDLYPGALDKQRQEVMLGVRSQFDITVIVDDIIAHPANAPVYLAARSQYRTQLTQNYALMRDMINRSSPELREQIVDLKLIDDVRWLWRRYSLRSLMKKADEIEMKLPQNVIQKWVDEVKTNPTGFFAQRRLAGYKVEMDAVSIDEKVKYLLAHPAEAGYFFKKNSDFQRALVGRPDLFLEMFDNRYLFNEIRNAKLLECEGPDRYTYDIAWQVIKNATPQQLKKIKDKELLGADVFTSLTVSASKMQLQKWFEACYPVDIQDKGKSEEINNNNVKKVPKLIRPDLKAIDADLAEFSDHHKIVMFLPGNIIEIDQPPQNPDIRHYFDVELGRDPTLVDTVKKKLPSWAQSIVVIPRGVVSERFQMAFNKREIPVFAAPVELLAEEPVGFFAWIRNLLSKSKKNENIIVIDSEIDSDEGESLEDSQSGSKTMLFTSADESSSPEQTRSATKQKAEAKLQELESRFQSLLPALVERYNKAREKFLEGKYDEATAIIVDLCLRKIGESYQGIYPNDELGAEEILPVFMLILQRAHPGYIDRAMATKLQELAPDVGPLGILGQAAGAQAPKAPPYKKYLGDGRKGSKKKDKQDKFTQEILNKLLAGRSSVDQLFILEEIFKTIKQNPDQLYTKTQVDSEAKLKERLRTNYSRTQFRHIELLQAKYVEVVTADFQNPLVRQSVARSDLLDFEPRHLYFTVNHKTKPRKQMLELYAHDDVMMLQQVLKITTKRADKFKIGHDFNIDALAAYMIQYPEHALYFIADPRFSGRQDLILKMIDEGSVHLRKTIRDVFVDRFDEDLKEAVRKEADNLVKHPHLALEVLEKNIIFQRELEQYPDLVTAMIDRSSAELRVALRDSDLLKLEGLKHLNARLRTKFDLEVSDITHPDYRPEDLSEKLAAPVFVYELVEHLSIEQCKLIRAKLDELNFFEKETHNILEKVLEKAALADPVKSLPASPYAKIMRSLGDVVQDIIEHPQQALALMQENKVALAQSEHFIMRIIEQKDPVLNQAIEDAHVVELIEDVGSKKVIEEELEGAKRHAPK